MGRCCVCSNKVAWGRSVVVGALLRCGLNLPGENRHLCVLSADEH